MYTEHSKLYLKQSTIDTDRTVFKHYTEFNTYLVSQINYEVVKRFIIKIFNKNYSNNYFNKIYFSLSKLFKFAVMEGIIKVSPMDRLQKPKRPDQIERQELKFWTPEQFNLFINSVDDFKHKVMFTTLYFTGMRKGEMQSLQWKDINIKDETIDIHKTLYEGRNKITGSTWELTPPKTQNSIRIIKVDKNTLDQIKKLYITASKEIDFNTKHFVFGTRRAIPSTTLNRYFKQYIKLSGVNNINLHGLRHSHVSYLANQGVDMYAIANRIGDTITQVLQTYTHFFPDRQDEVIDSINKLHKSNSPSSNQIEVDDTKHRINNIINIKEKQEDETKYYN